MRLLGKIAVMLGVYKLRILAVGDCLTNVSTILVFVCKNRIVLAEFQYIDGSARWLTSFNYKATPNKFSVSRPGLRHICMRAGSPFPLFHYKIG